MLTLSFVKEYMFNCRKKELIFTPPKHFLRTIVTKSERFAIVKKVPSSLHLTICGYSFEFNMLYNFITNEDSLFSGSRSNTAELLVATSLFSTLNSSCSVFPGGVLFLFIFVHMM